MEFTNAPMRWDNTGTEPPEDLKNNGWQANQKPPANYFNAKWRKDYAVQKELQEAVNTLDETISKPSEEFMLNKDNWNAASGGNTIYQQVVSLSNYEPTDKVLVSIKHNIAKSQLKDVSEKNFRVNALSSAGALTLYIDALPTTHIYIVVSYLGKCTGGSLAATFPYTPYPTKELVGLGNVDNTSDVDKPVSMAVQAALNNKAPLNHTHYYAASSGINGPADSALCLENPVTISLKGGATGSATFDGEYDTEINVTSINPDNLSKVIPVSKGGTGATTVQGARSGLGLAEVASSGIYNDLLAIPFRTVSNRQELSNAIGSFGEEGGTVYLLPGVFDLTDSNFSIDRDGVMLIGSGKGTVLKLGANTRLSFLGNRCGIKNLTLTRETASTMELLLLDSGMETQFADGFIMDNVYIDCININGSTGFIKITSSGAKNFRILNTVINTDQTGVFVNGSAGLHYGIISGCCSNYPLTVPSGFTLGANINITEG